MGRRRLPTQQTASSGLAGALFSMTQQRVLGLLFGQPDRSFYASELISMVKAGSGAVQRELARLERSQLVTVRRLGTQKHYQANPDSPIFHELVGIARKTVGMAGPLTEALAPLAARITAAFVYGSIARQQDTARSDVDLMIVSDELTYADLFQALQSVESRLARPVNPTMYTRADWAARREAGNAFVNRVLAQPRLWLIGGEADLTA